MPKEFRDRLARARCLGVAEAVRIASELAEAPVPKVLPRAPEVPVAAAGEGTRRSAASRAGHRAGPATEAGTPRTRRIETDPWGAPDAGWYTRPVPTPRAVRPPRRSERLSEAGISVIP